MVESLTVALDWNPNTNHVGMYVAKAQGLYDAAGLAVTLASPHTDGYKTTPASKLADGSAQLACVPCESVISHATWPGAAKPKIQAVAALLQSDQSAIVTLKSSGLARPAQLDGMRYASYAARYEARIVQAMIRADGGKGDFNELTPPMLGIWDSLLKGEADATWVFMPWEGVQAARAGVELNAFKLADWGVPYPFSPVLAAHPELLASEPAALRAFLAATAQGYEWAAAHPAEAAELLCTQVAVETAGCPLPEPLQRGMVAASLQALVDSGALLGPGGRWGAMDMQVWERFLDWLSSAGLLTTKAQSRAPGGKPDATSLQGLLSGSDMGSRIPREAISAGALATNAFLPQHAA